MQNTPITPRLRAAKLLIERSAVGESGGASFWAKKIDAPIHGGNQRRYLIDKLDDFEFAKSFNNQGLSVWTLTPGAFAKLQSILRAAGLNALNSAPSSSSAAPVSLGSTAAKTGAKVPSKKTMAAQRPLCSSIEAINKHKLPNSFHLSDLDKKYKVNASGIKNTLNALAAFGALEKTRKDKSTRATLTPLGLRLRSADAQQRMDAFREAFDAHEPYAVLSQKQKLNATREECCKALIKKFGWSLATATDALASFCKDSGHLGRSISFGGDAKGSAVARREKSSDASKASASPEAARQARQDDIDAALGAFAHPLRPHIKACSQEAYATLFSPARSKKLGATDETILKTFSGACSLEALRIGASIDEKKTASEVLLAMHAHGWLRQDIDYASGAKHWSPTPTGRVLMRALHELSTQSRSGGSFGSFRNCLRSLQDYFENPEESEPLLEAERLARLFCEDLSAESDRWRGGISDLVAHYEDAPSFEAKASDMLRRNQRLSQQINTHGAEANWAALSETLARLENLSSDPRLDRLCQDMNYYLGEDGPWSGSPQDALHWVSAQIRSHLEIARKERTQELIAELHAFSTTCHQLLRSRATRDKTRSIQANLISGLGADSQSSGAFAQSIVESIFPALRKHFDASDLEMKWRPGRRFEPLAPPAAPTPWQDAAAALEAIRQASLVVNPADCIQWLESASLDGHPVTLSEAFSRSEPTPVTLAACQMAEVYCSRQASSVYCKPLLTESDFGPVRRLDCLLIPKAYALRLLSAQSSHRSFSTETP